MNMKQRKGRTLEKKVRAMLTGILFCISIIFIAQLIYVENINRNYRQIDMLTGHYNAILSGTENLRQDITEYMYGYGSQEQIQETSRELRENADAFRTTINRQWHDRKSIDLYNLVVSYIECGEERIRYFDEHQYETSVKYGQEFSAIGKYIVRSFAEADSSLRESIEIVMEYNAGFLRIFRIVVTVVCVISAVLFIRLGRLLYSRFLDPVSVLSEASGNYKTGDDFESKCRGVNFQEKDEIGILASNIMGMVLRLEQTVVLEQKNSEMQLRVLHSEQMENKAQLKFLQSRINSHFLFNSLSMIGETAYLEDAGKTYELMEALGAFLRYNLDNFDKVVKLKEEVDNLMVYFVLQQKRFGDRIDFQIYYDEKAGDIQVPCLILQPLVENAVVHGVGHMKKDGKITVEIRYLGDKIKISISDNGAGMEKEELCRVRRLIETAEERNLPDDIKDEGGHDCIGIRNVFGRLKIYFGSRIQISVESEPYVKTEFSAAIWQGCAGTPSGHIRERDENV